MGRYVIKEVLGKGGMGVVYRTYDTETKREVTLKTLLEFHDPASLNQFRKECEMLISLNHPNIVDIYDIGEMEDADGKKPYLVMPLLAGTTLDKLIAGSSQRLTVERVVDIMTQVCRGLQAAHERGLVHRDIKPSNIFVLNDDSVKIIDFGIAHLMGSHTSTALKGTVHYMAPEQIRMQKPTPLSDLFSLGVVCYEALTRRWPFTGAGAEEVFQAILTEIPAPASDVNPAVSQVVSQVIHKAMAKQPWQRFASVREFAEILQKAARGEAMELFDRARVASRVERAQKALDTGEYDYASEVLGGLEAEGCLHPELASLRRRVDGAIRERTVRQLLDKARLYYAEEEYQLALQKTQEALQLEPENTGALTLRSELEARRGTEQIERWLHLAREHLENHAYGHARQAIEKVMKLNPADTRARSLLEETEQREQEYLRVRKEKEDLYQRALEAWHKGEVSAALAGLEQVLELDHRAPETDAPGRAAAYHSLYNQVRSDHRAIKDAHEEARKRMEQRNFNAALAICDEYLARYPGHALFEALKVDVEEHQRQELSAFIARVDREVEAEPDLEKRAGILRQALERYPGETHFERALQLTASRRDLVNSIAAKARAHQERGQYSESLAQWDILRTIYPRYPGLDVEIERTGKRPDRQSERERFEAIVGFLRRKLEEVPAPETPAPETPAPETPRPVPAKRRKAQPLVYFSAAVILVLGVVLAAVLIFRERGTPVPALAPAPPPVATAAPEPAAPPPPPPSPSALIVRGALPGTQILMNGKPLGTADSRGNFSITGLSEGRKKLLLRKKNYRAREMAVTIASGKESVLEGALERTAGLLIFEALQPREISMTIEPSIGAKDYSGPRHFAQLPAQHELVTGTYNLTFSARGYEPETYTVEVSDRETKRIPIRLKKR